MPRNNGRASFCSGGAACAAQNPLYSQGQQHPASMLSSASMNALNVEIIQHRKQGREDRKGDSPVFLAKRLYRS